MSNTRSSPTFAKPIALAISSIANSYIEEESPFPAVMTMNFLLHLFLLSVLCCQNGYVVTASETKFTFERKVK